MLVRFNSPCRLLEQLLCTHRFGSHMDYLAIGSTEITGYVPTVLLQLPIHSDNFKVTDLMIRGDEMLAKVFANLRI